MSHACAICARFTGMIENFSLEVAFEAPRQGVTALFGPSGCGKTSVLRAIAGLTHFPDGLLRFGEKVWQNGQIFLPPHRRPTGYVFQEPSLFAHLDVRGNLLFAYPKNDAARSIRYEETIEFLNLAPLLGRSPATLSGGERQRVAIGRALLSQPELLLMDEPLSALDACSREAIIPYLDGLSARFALPMFYVSHDFSEIERLADWLVLMKRGRVLRAGPLQELQSDVDLPLAKTREATAAIFARAVSREDGLEAFEVDGQKIWAPANHIALDRLYRLSVKAGEVSLALAAPSHSSILNILSVTLVSLTPLNEAEIIATLRLGETDQGQKLLARITRRSAVQLALVPGQKLFAQIKGVNIRSLARNNLVSYSKYRPQ